MNNRASAVIVSLLVICAAAVLLILTFLAIGYRNVPENPFTTVGVVAELFFAVLTASTFISVLLGSHTKRKFKYYFLWMLVLNTVGLLSDVVYWGIGLEALPGLPLLQEISYYVCHATAFPLLVFYSTYLLSYINEDSREMRRYAILVGGLSSDGFLMVIASIITAHSASQPWHLSDSPWLYFFFLTLPMIVIITIIYEFRKMLTNRKAIFFLFYELLVATAVVVDTIIGEITLAYVITAFCLIQIYITVQIEYEKEQEKRLQQQRISIMLSQIHPHFLFNTLTSIRALCRSDAEKAEIALTDFTIYLRGNIDSLNNTGSIPFIQELEHTKRYVELERMRFGKDLTVKINTPVTQFLLPPLTLEPVVENAVRHGVMQRRCGGTVMITTSEDEKNVFVTVADNGVGFDVADLSDDPSEHIGLWSVRERLADICGGKLEIKSIIDCGTKVMLIIPKNSNGGNRT